MTTPSPFLPNTRFFPEEGTRLQRELNLSYNDIASAVNVKEIGVYPTQAIATGQQFFSTSSVPFRSTLRQVFTLSSIASGTNQIAHGINVVATTVFTKITGTATNPSTKFLPLPYLNVTTPGDSIELRVTPTNVEIVTTTANYAAYNAIVILEWIPS